MFVVFNVFLFNSKDHGKLNCRNVMILST